MLSILCHFHGLLFARQVLEKPMCRHLVQFAALRARCSSAPHRLSLSPLAILLLIETTSQAIYMSELPVIRPLAENADRLEWLNERFVRISPVEIVQYVMIAEFDCHLMISSSRLARQIHSGSVTYSFSERSVR